MAFPGLHDFAHQDRERVDLLAGGAARNPDTEGVVVRARLQQCRQRHFHQCVKCLRIAEKIRHTDQKFLKEDVEFVRILLEIADILRRPLELVKIHPPLDAPPDRVGFVGGKVVACACAQ